MSEVPSWTAPTNLPAPVTSFIGRDSEIAELTHLLGGTRFLTLTGAGGVGKTRLAIQTAGGLISHYPDGVWLVELAPVSNPALVAHEIASSLGVPERHGRPPLDILADYLRPRRALILLDNCEHLIDQCAELVDALLHACPQLQILATSREALGIEGETDWRTPSLGLPDLHRLPPVDHLVQLEAIQLFVERGAAALPSFRLTDQNAAAVAQICSRLDGIPLAIELTAARVKVLSAKQIAARLDNLFRLLTAGSRTALPRQQTLRATVDWSYELLGDAERCLFNRLSVFAGGWTLEAAEAICAGEGVDQDAVLELLAHLVEKSLALADAHGVEMRYRLLEPMRQYAAERLRDCGEEALLRGRHLAWFVRFAEQAEPELRGSGMRSWLERLETEHDNPRAALEWSSRDGGDAEAMLRVTAALPWFWWIRGHTGEGRVWLERALRKPSGASALRGRALGGAAWLAHQQQDLATGELLAHEGLAIARELGDGWTMGWLLHLLGRVHYLRNDALTARHFGQESLRIAREEGDPWLVAWALHLLGLCAHIQGDLAAARSLYGESMAIRREMGNEDGIGILLALRGLAAHGQGDDAAARSDYAEGLALNRELGFAWLVAQHLAGFAALAAAAAQPERAVRLASAALALSDVVGMHHIPLYQASLDETLGLARRSLTEEAYRTARLEGAAMSVDQAAADALAVHIAPVGALPTGPAAGQPQLAASRHDAPGRLAQALSPRETEVLRLIVDGRTSKEIAAELIISLPTVQRHIAHIYAKVGARRRAEATAYALKHGLI